MDPKRFVRKVWQGLPRLPKKEETGKWAMGQGVVWIRRPEMWCPYCEVSWVNGWTWLVNEKRGRVEAVWGEDGQKKYLGGIHPHVMSGGEVCTGGFSVIEAITSGFNILSCFNSDEFVEIMDRLGHEGCEQERAEEEDDDRMACESCYRLFDDDEISFYDSADKYLCDRCWRNISVRCDNCHGRFYCPDSGSRDYPLTTVQGGDEMCGSCLEDYSYCEECEQYIHNDDMHPWSPEEDEPICERCWRDARAECQECGQLEPEENVPDGICQRCLDRIEEKEEDAAMADDGSEQLELPLTAERVEDETED